MRLIAIILGCSVALAQPQAQTLSGVSQVVVLDDLGKGAPAPLESPQYSLLTGAETASGTYPIQIQMGTFPSNAPLPYAIFRDRLVAGRNRISIRLPRASAMRRSIVSE
jgi:hypothetical protein